MKKLFTEAKKEIRFKFAGQGHKLTDGTTIEPKNPTDEPAAASLNAALQRCSSQSIKKDSKTRCQKEADIENRATSTSSLVKSDESPSGTDKSSAQDSNMQDKCNSSGDILFTCDEFANILLSKEGWKEKFRTYISDIKSTDPIQASILAVNSLNSDDKAEHSIKILTKYVENLIEFPDVDKYKLIRLQNPTMQKLLKIEGTMDFFTSIGFEKELQKQEQEEQKQEEFLVFHYRDGVELNNVLSMLRTIQGFKIKLHRNLEIIIPHKDTNKEDYPDKFFQWTVEDIRKEHKFRMKEHEKNQILRTRKMKMMDEKPKIISNYTVIRVRFPDGLIIQGTFATNEKLSNLRTFLAETIDIFGEYHFVYLPTKIFDPVDEEKSFVELELYPAAILMLKWVDHESKTPQYKFKESVSS